jgi:hypothetical protein
VRVISAEKSEEGGARSQNPHKSKVFCTILFPRTVSEYAGTCWKKGRAFPGFFRTSSAMKAQRREDARGRGIAAREEKR